MLDKITQEGFIQLLSSLSLDLKSNLENWENTHLFSFLEVMKSWVEDMDGFYINQNKPILTNVSWHIFADILLAARIYE